VVKLSERLVGRFACDDIYNPTNPKELFAKSNEEIDEIKAKKIDAAGVEKIKIRSVLTCESKQGVCICCYGRNLATGGLVKLGEAVGIIAAQSIGEPGTQLTMRTFHTGGVAGRYLTGVVNVKQKQRTNLEELHEDIRRGIVDFGAAEGSERERVRSVQAVLKVLEDQVSGLLRVVELFEARKPKGQAIVTEHAGTVAAIERMLLRDGLVMRYRTEHVDDGLPPEEGVFLACSCWLADNYLLLGRQADAQRMFSHLLGLCNDVGLLSEEYDCTARRLVGNFPQAFSHIALVNTAYNLGQGSGSAHDQHLPAPTSAVLRPA
jgi:hypothetical protein